jgi:hypothetical protein
MNSGKSGARWSSSATSIACLIANGKFVGPGTARPLNPAIFRTAHSDPERDFLLKQKGSRHASARLATASPLVPGYSQRSFKRPRYPSTFADDLTIPSLRLKCNNNENDFHDMEFLQDIV